MKSAFLAFVIGLLSACSAISPPAGPVQSSQDQTVALADLDTHQAFCTGVWVAQSWVLTANHCVADEASFMLEVRERGGEALVGEPTFKDERHDLALVHVAEPPVKHAIVSVADFHPPVGERVHVCGHPAGMLWSYTEGVVSAYRTLNEFPDDFKENGFVGPVDANLGANLVRQFWRRRLRFDEPTRWDRQFQEQRAEHRLHRHGRNDSQLRKGARPMKTVLTLLVLSFVLAACSAAQKGGILDVRGPCGGDGLETYCSTWRGCAPNGYECTLTGYRLAPVVVP